MAYYARRVKRKCEIRGCRNTDSFAISKSREPGNSVIMCGECLKAFALEVDNVPKVKKKAPSIPPSLFFGDTLKKTSEGADNNNMEIGKVDDVKSDTKKTAGKKNSK